MSHVDDLFELIQNNGYTAETKVEVFKEDADVLLPLGKKIHEHYKSLKNHFDDDLAHYNKLKETYDIMNDINVIVRAEIERKKKYIEDNREKREFYDLVVKTPDKYTFDEIAERAGCSTYDVIQILHHKNILLKTNDEPSQKFIKKGWMKLAIDPITYELVTVATKQGIEPIVKLIKEAIQ